MARQPQHVKIRGNIKRNRTLLVKRGNAKFETLEEFAEAINDYFKVAQEEERPFTCTGLYIHLGISCECFRHQEARGIEWADICQQARMIIENYAEESLFVKDKFNGAKFALINRNPRDWKDKSQTEVTGNDGQPFNIIIQKFTESDSEEQ